MIKLSRFQNIRPDSIKADKEEIKSLIGRQMDRIGELTSRKFSEQRTEQGRRGILLGVAFGLGFMEATLAKDLPEDYYSKPVVKKMKTEFANNTLNFKAGDLLEWYRLMANTSKGLMPVPSTVYEFEDEAEETVLEDKGMEEKDPAVNPAKITDPKIP